MGAELDKETLDALRESITGELRKDVVDLVRGILDESKKSAGKEEAPNPNAERFADQAKRVEGKISASLDNAAKEGYEPGLRFARVLQAFLGSDHKSNRVSGAMDLLKKWGDNGLRTKVERAMELETPKYGGLVVPEELSMEMIELLRPTSVLARAQPRRIGLKGKLRLLRKKAGTQSYWTDPRGRLHKSSKPTMGSLTLDEKALTSIAAFPKRLAQLSLINIAMFLRDEILEEMGVKLDYAFFNGKGNEFEPLGLYNMPDTGELACNWVDVNAAPDWMLPIKMRQKAREVNSTFIRPYWFMAPALETLLMCATPNGGTNPIWFNSMNDKSQLLGNPYEATNHVPVASISNNPTFLTYMDMAQYLLGQEGDGFEFAETDVGGYYDEDGAISLPFADGEVAVKAIWRGDMAARNPLCITHAKRVRTT